MCKWISPICLTLWNGLRPVDTCQFGLCTSKFPLRSCRAESEYSVILSRGTVTTDGQTSGRRAYTVFFPTTRLWSGTNPVLSVANDNLQTIRAVTRNAPVIYRRASCTQYKALGPPGSVSSRCHSQPLDLKYIQRGQRPHQTAPTHVLISLLFNIRTRYYDDTITAHAYVYTGRG